MPAESLGRKSIRYKSGEHLSSFKITDYMHIMANKNNKLPKKSNGGKKPVKANKFLHNLPTFSTYILGAIIMLFLGWALFIIYILYTIFSTLWFMKFICAYCPHYDSPKCPSGYSEFASKLFKKGESRKFNSMFKKHIGVVFPSWILPVLAGIYMLFFEFSITILVLFIAFIIMGFIMLPFITKRYGCEECDLKESCPRMAGFKKRRR